MQFKAGYRHKALAGALALVSAITIVCSSALPWRRATIPAAGVALYTSPGGIWVNAFGCRAGAISLGWLLTASAVVITLSLLAGSVAANRYAGNQVRLFALIGPVLAVALIPQANSGQLAALSGSALGAVSLACVYRAGHT